MAMVVIYSRKRRYERTQNHGHRSSHVGDTQQSKGTPAAGNILGEREYHLSLKAVTIHTEIRERWIFMLRGFLVPLGHGYIPMMDGW